MQRVFALLMSGCCLVQLLAGTAGAALAPPSLPAGLEHNTPAPAAGLFLVARRDFTSPFFHHTVIFLLQHDAQASFGVIVNRPGQQRLAGIVADVPDTWPADLPVYYGGPVERQELTIVLRTSRPPFLSEPVTGDIHFSVYPQLLHDLALQQEPGLALRCYTGFASWSPGQLEDEIGKGYWHLVAADPALIFEGSAEHLWDTLIRTVEQVIPVGIKGAE